MSDPLARDQARCEQRGRAAGIAAVPPLRPEPKATPGSVDEKAKGTGDAAPADPWQEFDDAIDAIGTLEREKPSYRATLVPDETQIVVAYKSVERGRVAKGAFKWLALFQIIECEVALDAVGRLILRSWNEPRRGWLSPKHALARDFAAVCRLPLRGLPPSASPNAVLGSFLRDVYVLATTHTVSEFVDAKTKQVVKREPWEHYSVIASIGGLAAGSPKQPRFLSRRRRG